MIKTKIQTVALELVKQVAMSNKDNDMKFMDKQRLNVIHGVLSASKYRRLANKPTFNLYAKKSLKELDSHLLVISTFVDGSENNVSFENNEETLNGNIGNVITNAAILALMLEGDMPEDVVVTFSRTEENNNNGVGEICKYLKSNKKSFDVIMLSTTKEGWKENAKFTFENVSISKRESWWAENIVKTADNSGCKWVFVSAGDQEAIMNCWEDGSKLYNEHGINCFSLCLPCSGETDDNVHNQQTFEVKTRSFYGYINMLKELAKLEYCKGRYYIMD